MTIVSKPSKAIRAPIVWNRPTAGMFDYHYDLAGLYYQVVVIAMNAKTMVKETDTSPSSRWSTTVKSERRVEHGGWSTCQIVLSPTLTREPSEMFFSPPRLWFIRNHIKLWHFFIISQSTLGHSIWIFFFQLLIFSYVSATFNRYEFLNWVTTQKLISRSCRPNSSNQRWLRYLSKYIDFF